MSEEKTNTLEQEKTDKQKPISRATLSQPKMERILAEGLENKTILKKEKNQFVSAVKKIEAEPISNKEKLAKIKDVFWKMFGDRVSPRKKGKKEGTIAARFAAIGEKKE